MSSISSGTTTTTALVYTADTTGNLVLQTNGTTTAATFDTNQNMGLGVTPSAWNSNALAIQSGVSGSGSISFNKSTPDTLINSNAYLGASGWVYSTSNKASQIEVNGANGNVAFYVASSGTAGNAITFTQAMTLDNSGNLLVGTTSALLTSSGRGNITLNGSTDSLMAFGSGGTAYGYINATTSAFNISAYQSSTPLVFLTGGGERARIDTSGNLLVGTTSSSSTSGVGFKFNYDASYPAINIVGTATTGGSAGYYLYSTGAGAFRFYADYSGTIHATSTTITAISDQRLKENVRDLDVGLAEIISLKPRRFDWKQGKGLDKKDDIGFIAQEFETVFPNSVTNSLAGEDGIEYKAVSQSELIPTLVKAIQELSAQVTTLQSQVAALKA